MKLTYICGDPTGSGIGISHSSYKPRLMPIPDPLPLRLCRSINLANPHLKCNSALIKNHAAVKANVTRQKKLTR
jgi:hypothetical protein